MGKSILEVKLSPDDKYVATGCSDHAVRIFDATSLELLAEIVEHHELVNSVSFCRKEPLLASGSFDGSVNVISLEEGPQ